MILFLNYDFFSYRDKNEDMDELTNNFSKAQLGDFENKVSVLLCELFNLTFVNSKSPN